MLITNDCHTCDPSSTKTSAANLRTFPLFKIISLNTKKFNLKI